MQAHDTHQDPILSDDIYRAIFDYSSCSLGIIEEDGTISLANTRLSQATGWSQGELEGTMTWRMLVVPEDREKVEAFIRCHRCEPASADIQTECRMQRKDGTFMDVLLRVNMVRGTKKSVISAMDITELRQTEEALKVSERRFRGAFEGSGAGMAIIGLDGRWLKVNRSLCNSLGYSEEELLAKTFQDITHPDDLKKDLEHLKRLIDDRISYYEVEKRYYHRDGYAVWVLLCASMVRDSRGYPLYFVAQIVDITERKFLEEKLETALITDELTGLYNRYGFFERGHEQLHLASGKGETCTLFLVKLDDMKLVNDTLGHKQGDAIIKDVGRMLQGVFDGKDVIGRIGGVEFAVLTGSAAQMKATRLEERVAGFGSDGAGNCPVSLTVHAGRCYPEEQLMLEQLVARVNETGINERRRKLKAM